MPRKPHDLVPEPQFFLHAGDGSTPFADLEAAKALGRRFPSAAYIQDLKGQVLWEKTKSGKESE